MCAGDRWAAMDAGTGVGPKAESLRTMCEAGLPVPDLRFVPAGSYREHARRAGVGALLVTADDDPLDPAAVRAALEAAPVDAALAAELVETFDALGGGPVAVRSSGTAEDMPDASFAGQHGTFFVADATRLPAAVRECWASLFSDRAVRYRERAGVPHAEVAMAVIVQRLVPALCAGVAFTVDPLDGSDRVLVESCFGIGEALVSGKVSPDSFTFDRDGLALVHRTVGVKPVQVIADEAGHVREEALGAATANSLSIDEPTARRVARLALDAEQLFGHPVDVEWAFDGDRVWLLQARPITAFGRTAAVTSPAAERDTTIWSNVNTGEILPDVATPMTWSIIHEHADDIVGGMLGAFGAPFDAKLIIGLVGGRIYFNLTLLRETFRTIPGIDPDIALGGMQNHLELPTFEGTKPSGATRLRAGLRMARNMPPYIWRHTPKKARAFAADMRAKTEAGMSRIAEGPDEHGALRIVHSLNGEFPEFNDALAYMAVAMFGFGLLGGLTKAWLDDETGALANRMVAGRGDVASADAGHDMWRLSALAQASKAVRSAVLVGSGWDDVRARLEVAAASGDVDSAEFLRAWDDFMVEHGHHRRGELEFSNPTWAEMPDYVLGMVRSYMADDRGGDPLGDYARRSAEADATAAESMGRLRGPLRKAVFRRVLGWARESARTRENMKSEAIRWLTSIRHALLALGGRMVEVGVLARADDIFFLEYDELPDLVALGSRDYRNIIAARRAEHLRFESLTPPPVVIGAWDEAPAVWAESDTRTLTGITVSAGVARGPARVFLTADTDEVVYPGEILVAPFTDPGWTPYFVPAAGIVMDMGGLLSHGSIIAREYGIPAVVNVGPATRIITTGQIIEVDGDAGEVRIIG